MTVTIFLYRHGMTAGNREKRYIGSTDEPLCPEGMEALARRHFEKADLWVASPLLRCRQTADAAAGEGGYLTDEGLREIDFGEYEGKTWRELSGRPDYQAFIDSGGTLPFPGGEAPEDFRARCRAAFAGWCERALEEKIPRVGMVVHDGTIKSILSGYALPQRAYFDWITPHLGGWRLTLEERPWREEKKIRRWDELT